MTTVTKEISGAEVRLDDVMACSVRGQDVDLENVMVLGLVRAERDLRIEDGACGPVRAQTATIGDGGTAGIVIADRVSVETGATVMHQVPRSTARGAAIGLAVGAVAGLVCGRLMASRR
ncbi:MAG: hypothetical protein ACM3OO_10505 [Planctomycetaceae bacterium]